MLPTRSAFANSRTTSPVVSIRQFRGRVLHVEHFDPAVEQVFAGVAGVISVMAFAREDQDLVSGAGQLKAQRPTHCPTRRMTSTSC